MRVTKKTIVISIIVLLISIAGLILINYQSNPINKLDSNGYVKASLDSSKTLEPQSGWYDGKTINYYQIDKSPATTGKLYTLVSGFDADGNPLKILGQKDIFSTERGDKNYSDFWDLIYVTAPSNYQPDSIRSQAELTKQNWPLKDTHQIINQPQVYKNTQISPNKEKLEGWYNNRRVYSWRFDSKIARDLENKDKILTQNLFIIVQKKDKKTIRKVPGELNILDTAPDDKNYSPLRQVVLVVVPDDYKPGTLKSVDDILNSDYSLLASDLLINCPVEKSTS